MKTAVGLVLLSLGVSLFLLSFLLVTKTDTVVDVSFVLEPSEKRGPGQNGIYHHTRVFSKSVLMGDVLVEGGAINFTANGYNTRHFENIFISENCSFVVDPADDLYWFTFENTNNDVQSSVTFTLKERWVNILSLIPAFVVLLILAPAGMVLIIMGSSEETRRKRRFSENFHHRTSLPFFDSIESLCRVAVLDL